MRNWLKLSASLLITMFCFISVVNAEQLTAKKLNEYKDSKGVILLAVNWGRKWGCGKYENAQLINLSFDLMSDSGAKRNSDSKIVLKTPSILMVNDEYKDYGFIVDPGEYAITGVKIKVAKSVSDIGYFEAGPEKLLKDGKPEGGTMVVNAGEVIYVGHFFLDCYEDPTLWRYYPDGQEAFKSYKSAIEKKYPFLKKEDIKFRLLKTSVFGIDYVLEQVDIHE